VKKSARVTPGGRLASGGRSGELIAQVSFVYPSGTDKSNQAREFAPGARRQCGQVQTCKFLAKCTDTAAGGLAAGTASRCAHGRCRGCGAGVGGKALALGDVLVIDVQVATVASPTASRSHKGRDRFFFAQHCLPEPAPGNSGCNRERKPTAQGPPCYFHVKQAPQRPCQRLPPQCSSMAALVPPPRVLGPGDQLEVVGSLTQRHLAQMVDRHAFRDRLVGKTAPPHDQVRCVTSFCALRLFRPDLETTKKRTMLPSTSAKGHCFARATECDALDQMRAGTSDFHGL
jgi:hypothetical protein